MKIDNLYECLSALEKKQLRELLAKEEREMKAGIHNVTLADWLTENINDLSRRAYNCLRVYAWQNKNALVGDVEWDDVRRQRNFGLKSWAEFIKLRGY